MKTSAERALPINLAQHEQVERLLLSTAFVDPEAFRVACLDEGVGASCYMIPAHGRVHQYFLECAKMRRKPDALELATIDPAFPEDRVVELLETRSSHSELPLYVQTVHANSEDRHRASELHKEYVGLTGAGIGAPNDTTPPERLQMAVSSVSEDEKNCATRVNVYRPFPVNELPEPLRSFVTAGAKSMLVDPAFLALPLLSAIAATIGGTRRVRLTGDWHAPSIIWTAIVGESGTRKTPAIELSTSPLVAIEAEEAKKNAERMKEHEVALERHDRDCRKWRAKDTAGDPPEKPDPPALTRRIVSDATVESVAPILADNPRGVLLIRDELAGWTCGFDRYASKAGGDRASWLPMWAGSSLTVDRKTGAVRTIHVTSAAVSVTGGIQPGILDRMFDRADRDAGLLARVLVAMPPRQPKRFTDASVSETTRKAIHAVFARLRDLDFSYNIDGDPEPKLIRLTPEAADAWRSFVNEHGREQAELTGDLAAAFSKLESYAARFALVFHCVRQATDDPTIPRPEAVDHHAISAGINLVRWFSHEARRLYAFLGMDDTERTLLPLVEKIRGWGGTVTVRDWQRSRSHSTAETAENELGELVAAAFGVWETPPQVGPGRPASKRFVLHAESDTDNNPRGDCGGLGSVI